MHIDCNRIIKSENLALYQAVGAKHGVTVRIIAREGEQYSHLSFLGCGKFPAYHGIVQPQELYVAFTGTLDKAFWQDVRKRQLEDLAQI